MDNLKPCPFCASPAQLVEDEPTKGWCFVECTCCAAHGPMTDKKHAVMSWNRRMKCVPTTATVDEIDVITNTEFKRALVNFGITCANWATLYTIGGEKFTNDNVESAEKLYWQIVEAWNMRADGNDGYDPLGDDDYDW